MQGVSLQRGEADCTVCHFWLCACLTLQDANPERFPGCEPALWGGGADTFRYRPPSGELFPKKEFSVLLAKVAIKTKLLGWLKSPSHFFCKMKDTFFSFSPITLLILIF